MKQNEQKPLTKKPKVAKAGRPKQSEIDRLRAKVWYRAVKSCGNWSDYKLDMQFGQVRITAMMNSVYADGEQAEA